MDIINLKGEWQALTYTQTEPSTEGDQLPDVIKTIDCGLSGVSERLEELESSQEVVGLKTRLMSFCAVHAFLAVCARRTSARASISQPPASLYSATRRYAMSGYRWSTCVLNKWRSLAPDPPSACLAAIKTVSLCPGRKNTSLNRSCTDRPRIVLQGLTRNAVFAHPLVRRSLPAQTRTPVSVLDGTVLIRASVRHILVDFSMR